MGGEVREINICNVSILGIRFGSGLIKIKNAIGKLQNTSSLDLNEKSGVGFRQITSEQGSD